MASDKNKSENSGTSAAVQFHDALTPERLDGTNYDEWSLNAQNKIRGRKRWGYVTGTKTAPAKDKSDEYEAWEDENCLVKSWLLDSMTKEIRSLFIRLATAKEIWDTAKETYSVEQDASKAYQLHREKYNKMVNSQGVYVFLAGLDSHLDGLRGRILATTPLPNVQSVYATVCAEANRQETMLNGEPSNGSAFAVKKCQKKEIRKCNYCNGDNHFREGCFKLHGYPDWHPKGKTTLNNKTENTKAHLSTAAGFVTKSGISNSAHNLSVITKNSDWIIDTGATDHMTCDQHMCWYSDPLTLPINT
ncbi:hypothetical protein TSUD_47290 [Trifolium subterraneum]|nr:hypothetical protein TSUD_47290 [Trifolium subterraneum]